MSFLFEHLLVMFAIGFSAWNYLGPKKDVPEAIYFLLLSLLGVLVEVLQNSRDIKKATEKK